MFSPVSGQIFQSSFQRITFEYAKMEHNSKPGEDAEDKIHDVNGDESKSVDRSEVDGILWEANLSQIRNIVNENKIK